MRHSLKHHIPDYWTADVALCFVGFLDRLATAVWDQHGPAMSDLLESQLAHEPDQPTDDDAALDDEFPF